MKKMSKKIAALTLGLGIISAQSAFASFSEFGTFDVGNSETYYTSSGVMLPGYKDTTSTTFSVYASSKTMTSAPSVRLVNSSGAARSSYVSVPEIENIYRGSNNTGTPGFYYYASVKPAWNQAGTDSIRLNHNPQ